MSVGTDAVTIIKQLLAESETRIIKHIDEATADLINKSKNEINNTTQTNAVTVQTQIAQLSAKISDLSKSVAGSARAPKTVKNAVDAANPAAATTTDATGAVVPAAAKPPAVPGNIMLFFKDRYTNDAVFRETAREKVKSLLPTSIDEMNADAGVQKKKDSEKLKAEASFLWAKMRAISETTGKPYHDSLHVQHKELKDKYAAAQAPPQQQAEAHTPK